MIRTNGAATECRPYNRSLEPEINLRNSKEVNDSTNRRTIPQQHLARLLAILLVTSTAFGFTQSAPAPARAVSATEQHLLDSLSVATIKETVNALAADDMRGRGTAQAGGDKAAALHVIRCKCVYGFFDR